MIPVGIIPYSPYSKGAKQLSKLLDCFFLIREHFNEWDASRQNWSDGFRKMQPPTKFTSVINWGVGGGIPIPKDIKVFNKPKEVAAAVNKTTFFKAMAAAKDGPRIPLFTESAEQAMGWVNEGKTIMARQVTEGKMGQGILFYDEDELPQFLNAPLFVEFILNLYEFRAHFAFGEIIYWQKKDLTDAARAAGNVDFRVRSHRNGFYFMSQGDFRVPEDVQAQAMKAVKASGLDFGALDIVYNRYYDKAYILECNTAPGIDEGKTAEKYADAFRKALT